MPTFNAQEALEMAVRIERNGGLFYRQAAERFSEGTLHALLLRLAKMEDQHERTFERLHQRLFGDRPDNRYAEYEDLAAAYLHALVDNEIFFLDRDPAEALGAIETAEQLLEAAIEREKESITFYVGIREATPPEWDRDAIDEIIREEMSHVALLTEELARLR